MGTASCNDVLELLAKIKVPCEAISTTALANKPRTPSWRSALFLASLTTDLILYPVSYIVTGPKWRGPALGTSQITIWVA
jgi:hypothetical protein